MSDFDLSPVNSTPIVACDNAIEHWGECVERCDQEIIKAIAKLDNLRVARAQYSRTLGEWVRAKGTLINSANVEALTDE